MHQNWALKGIAKLSIKPFLAVYLFKVFKEETQNWIYFCLQSNILNYGLRTPSEEIALSPWPKIKPQSIIFRYGRSIFCLPHRHKISDFFDSCLQQFSLVRFLNNELCLVFFVTLSQVNLKSFLVNLYLDGPQTPILSKIVSLSWKLDIRHCCQRYTYRVLQTILKKLIFHVSGHSGPF